MILGHNFEPTVQAVTAQAQKALSFGAPTEIEIELAEKIISFVPSMDRVRMVNSALKPLCQRSDWLGLYRSRIRSLSLPAAITDTRTLFW